MALSSFCAQRFPYTLDLVVVFPASGALPADSFADSIKGLNRGHALWRARQNWPGARIVPVVN